MINPFVQMIRKYIGKSAGSLRDQQVAHIPKVNNDQVEYITSTYYLASHPYKTSQDMQMCIKLRYLNILNKAIAKRKMDTIIPAIEAIDSRMVKPFAIFIGGVFIPLEGISIIHSDNDYILIDYSGEASGVEYTKYNSAYIQIMELPEYIKYDSGETDQDPDSIVFSFGEDGLYNTDDPKFIYKGTPNGWGIFDRLTSEKPISGLQVIDSTDIKLCEENCVLFVDGKLASENKELHRTYWAQPNQDVDDGHYVDLVESSGPMLENHTVRFDSSLLTIDDGINNNQRFDIHIFINTLDVDKNIDNISRIDIDKIKDKVKNENTSGDIDPVMRILRTPFELEMSRDLPYETNVANAIKAILNYNQSLVNDTLMKTANLEIRDYTGQEILDIVKPDGTISLSMYSVEHGQQFIIMLVNGLLYQYNRMIRYYGSDVIIPIQDIEPTDTVEFLIFKNMKNEVYTVTFDDQYHEVDPNIINEDMILFSPEATDSQYTYPENGLQSFFVPFSIDRNENGEVKVILKDASMYGKPITIAYDNRFKYFSMNLEQTYDKLTIDLGKNFMYCGDYNRYMVFYNGRRLGTEQYRLTLPVRKTTPFYKYNIYLAFPVMAGDRLDIFYAPNNLKDIAMFDDLNLSGDIVIHKENLTYPISSKTVLVWVNGKKVPATDIMDINANRMRIITDQKSTETVCITKIIPTISEFKDLYVSSYSLWDELADAIGLENLCTLLGVPTPVLTNDEPSIFDGSIPIKTIMYELIRDQYISNPAVDTTKEFLYNYMDVDDTVIEGEDSAGNGILNVMDSNAQDNLDDVERIWK